MRTLTATAIETMPFGGLPSCAIPLGAILLCVLAKRVSDATPFFPFGDWTPDLAQTTKAAIGEAPPLVETDWISSAVSVIQNGGATLWNWVPTSTRLVLAALVVVWAWKKSKGESGTSVSVQNHHKVEIHFHGCETKPEAVERMRRESDGSTTTVIDLKLPKKKLDGRKFALVNLNL